MTANAGCKIFYFEGNVADLDAVTRIYAKNNLNGRYSAVMLVNILGVQQNISNALYAPTAIVNTCTVV